MTSLKSVVPNMATASAAFGDLSADQQAEIWSRARIRRLPRGETLVLQNTPADAVFVVVSGRFEVRLEGLPAPLAEIGVGQPIGEIAFFAGGLRTATVVAVRDSVVLELDRASFEDVARRVPAIYDKLLAAMAHRLAETTARITGGSRVAAARTVTIVTAGHGGVPAAFFDRLRSAFASSGRCVFLSHADLKERFPDLQLEDPTILNWLNAIESEYELVVYLTEEEPTNWTRTAIRQADQVVLVAYGAATAGLNPVEDVALAVHPASRRRLVRIHDRRVSYTTGTAEWLRERDVTMSHHVSLERVYYQAK